VSGGESAVLVIVPDGLAAQNGKPLPVPSFAFRAVLDTALKRPAEDVLLLAPANSFGGAVTEEEVAETYLRRAGRTGAILRPPPVTGGYVDTRGNARHLRRWLEGTRRWPLRRARLLVTDRHADRAMLCFRKEGFVFEAVDRVSYRVAPGAAVVPRRWYYRHPFFHRLYEAGAYLRDWLRPAA